MCAFKWNADGIINIAMKEVTIYGLHPTKIGVSSGKRLHHELERSTFFHMGNQVYMAMFKSKVIVYQRISNQKYEDYPEFLMALHNSEDVF